ncbi:ROK family protein [Candidatus Parcubacteria bacterium]|nr:ROK family protein [Candidatus Parcubacteria bacterium]
MYIACDIGGTKFRVARSENCVDFDEPIIEETPDNPKEGIEFIIETIKNVASGKQIKAVCIGIAGVLDQSHRQLLKSPHLPEWERIALKEKFQNGLINLGENNQSPKIYIENDTDIVGLGEAVSGAGRGFEICTYITISTGIGGVKITNGRFEKNRFGFEPGFQIINNETGENFEDLCSGTAVEKKFNMHPKDVAQTNDWQEIEKNIAVGLHNSIIHWSPDVLVIGGSMSKDLDAERMRDMIASLMKIHPELPEIRIAELGSIGGIHGGLAFLKEKFDL